MHPSIRKYECIIPRLTALSTENEGKATGFCGCLTARRSREMVRRVPAPSGPTPAPPTGVDPAEVAAPAAAPGGGVPAGLGATAVRGVIWAASVTIANRGVSILAQLVLAAVLAPSEFGTFAKALFFSGLISQALAPAVDQFLVSRSKEFDRFAGPAFWLAAACGATSVGLHALLAPVAAYVQKNDALLYILPLLGVSNLLATCLSAATARLSIALRFRELAALGLISAVAIQALSVIGALAKFGVLALVLPMILVNGAVLAYYLSRGAMPGLWRSPFGEWREILASSTRLMGVRLLQSAVAQGDYFILGLFAGDATVGVYYIAFNLAEQVARLLGASVSGVLTPALAHIQDDPPRARAAVLNASRLLSVVVTPMSVCQILFAWPVLYAMFGEKYLAAVPLIQIMSAATIVNVPAWPAVAAMTAAGRFGELLRMLVVTVVIFGVLLTMGAMMGHQLNGDPGAAVGTAAGYASFSLAATVLGLLVALRSARAAWELLRQTVRPAAACAVAAVPIVALLASVPTTSRPGAVAAVAIGGLLFMAGYIASLRLLDPAGLDAVRQRLPRRGRQQGSPPTT